MAKASESCAAASGSSPDLGEAGGEEISVTVRGANWARFLAVMAGLFYAQVDSRIREIRLWRMAPDNPQTPGLVIPNEPTAALSHLCPYRTTPS